MSDITKENVINRMLEHDRPGRSFIAIDDSRWGELILPAKAEKSTRTEAGLRLLAVTSFLYSGEILDALFNYERAYPERLYLTAVATDDSANADAKIGLRKRVWKHYTQSLRIAMEVETIEKALMFGVPVYTGELKIDWFRRQLELWHLDVIIVCGCGQIFDKSILEMPRYGVYNFHPSDLAHGHGAGPEPYEDVLARNDPITRWTVHQMSEEVDAGSIVGQSPPIVVADKDGKIPQDARRFYSKLRGVTGSMLTILIEELVELHLGGNGKRIAKIDFNERLSQEIKSHLAEPIALD